MKCVLFVVLLLLLALRIHGLDDLEVEKQEELEWSKKQPEDLILPHLNTILVSNPLPTIVYNPWPVPKLDSNQSVDIAGVGSFGPREFANLSEDFFHSALLSQAHDGFIRNRFPSEDKSMVPQGLPKFVNWTHAVTPPGYQGILCPGGSHAFAVVSVVESAYFIKTGNLLNLSREQLLSCNQFHETYTTGTVSVPIEHGWMGNCLWGDVAKDYEYIQQHGLLEDSAYPYNLFRTLLVPPLAKPQKFGCQTANHVYNNKLRIAVDDYTVLENVDEEVIKAAVAKQPVTAMIDGRCLQWYFGGIFDPDRVDLIPLVGQRCRDIKPNHHIVIVGYGTEAKTGIDYWIFKNSWTDVWGEHGYGRLRRNVGALGINTLISWPNNVTVLPRVPPPPPVPAPVPDPDPFPKSAIGSSKLHPALLGIAFLVPFL